MTSKEAKTFIVEDATLIFRNFSGKEGQYNREGDRNFSVILDDESAVNLLNDGWNVRYLEPRDEGDAPTPYIQVTVNFNIRPPKVIMITSTARTQLTEDSVAVLDWADVQTADLIARGYEWAVNGKTGVKAYLQSLYITIREDELERKYAANPSDIL
jgi:hypothetical protein